MEIDSKPRSKTFMSMDSLWYEEERLATFIDWPIPFISSRDLAREGFYYLRTKDHCACAFCRGIIGAWEEGDTPSGEHKRHFPHCPFVQGKVTPNVPLTQGSILARVARVVTVIPDVNSAPSLGEDVCGTPKLDTLEYCSEGRVLTKSSSNEISMSSLGFRQYCGPKRRDYLTAETRLSSFKHWPEKVKQTPEDLSEAGFYYCGLSDHVRCFHCGNGLRNWEPEDDPWEEHARWFPDCHFVMLKKGIEFVDKVRRENPPYVPVKNKSTNGASTSGRNSFNLSDEEMDKLMELHVMKHVLEMGFSGNVVKKALKKRLIESGQPFYSVEACIDAVLLIMEVETKNTIHGCEDITSQVRKMAAYVSTTNSSHDVTIGNASGSSPLPEAVSSLSTNASEDVAVSSLPPLPNNNLFTPASPSHLPPLPNILRASPPLRSSTPTSQLEQNAPQSMEFETQSETSRNSQMTQAVREINTESDTYLPERSELQETLATQAAIGSPMELQTEVAPLITEADDIMEEAAKLLGTSSPSSTSTPSTSSTSSSCLSCTSTTSCPSCTSASSSSTSTSSTQLSSCPSCTSTSSCQSCASSASSSSSSSSVGTSSTSASSSSQESYSSQPSSLESVSSHESASSSDNSASRSTLLQENEKKDEVTSEVDDVKLGHQKSDNSASRSTLLQENEKKDEVTSEVDEVKLGHQKSENLALELQRMRENMMCKVCMDKEMDVVFLPCTHMVTCSSCAVALATCPICRRNIQYAFKPIIS